MFFTDFSVDKNCFSYDVKEEYSLTEAYLSIEGGTNTYHKCKICKKPFSRKDNLKRHLYNVHGIKKEHFKENII